MKGGGFAARGAEKRAGGLPPGRCAGGRSVCEPRYGRAPFGRSPAGRRGLLTRRLMIQLPCSSRTPVSRQHSFALRTTSQSRQIGIGINGRPLLGSFVRRCAGSSAVTILQPRPGKIVPRIAEIRSVLHGLLQHWLRVTRPLGNQKSSPIIRIKCLQRTGLLTRNPEQLVREIGVIEAHLSDSCQPMVNAALLGSQQKRLIEPLSRFSNVARAYRSPAPLGRFVKRFLSRSNRLNHCFHEAFICCQLCRIFDYKSEKRLLVDRRGISSFRHLHARRNFDG